jgi:hypothetical protein
VSLLCPVSLLCLVSSPVFRVAVMSRVAVVYLLSVFHRTGAISNMTIEELNSDVESIAFYGTRSCKIILMLNYNYITVVVDNHFQ